MAISFDQVLGVHEQALELRSKRAKVLANNMANADTPGYKAQDIDFHKALKNAMSGRGFELARTHASHYSSNSKYLSNQDLMFTIPNQPDTGDGNTVDAQKEQAKFAENALEYQMNLHFLSSKFKGMRKAIKGE